MYSPKNTKELFLVDDGNQFPIEAIREKIEFLEHNLDLQGKPVRLYRTLEGKVKISYETDKKPIIDFPLKQTTNKDAAIIIYEPPMDNPPIYLYISGADPYNQNESKKGSLGACYIYKRLYDPISGTYQRRIVASYAARPSTMKQWHEQVEMLLEVYNAICLPENEGGTFIQYFDAKNKGYMLADGYNFLKEISPNSSITGRVKGLPATTAVQKYYKALVTTYTNEKIQVGVSDTGEILEKLGVWRIDDLMLLYELLSYTDTGNYDRYIAFGHVLAHELWAEKIYPYIFKTEEEKNEKPKEMPRVLRSPFGLAGSANPFSLQHKTSRPNPFGINKTQIVKRNV